MLIRLLHQYGTHQPGAILERPDSEAKGLIRAGFAEPAPPGAVPTKLRAPETSLRPSGGETTDLPGPRS